jgi:hypothetical protein
MASPRQARGAVLRIRQGASGGGGSFDTIPLLSDVTDNLGTAQFLDTTSHDTPAGTTSQTPTHVEAGTLSAPFYFDGQDAVHTGLQATLTAMTKKDFQLHIPGSGSPGLRKSFAGYIESLATELPVNGLVRATLTVRADGVVTIEADV